MVVCNGNRHLKSNEETGTRCFLKVDTCVRLKRYRSGGRFLSAYKPAGMDERAVVPVRRAKACTKRDTARRSLAPNHACAWTSESCLTEFHTSKNMKAPLIPSPPTHLEMVRIRRTPSPATMRTVSISSATPQPSQQAFANQKHFSLCGSLRERLWTGRGFQLPCPMCAPERPSTANTLSSIGGVAKQAEVNEFSVQIQSPTENNHACNASTQGSSTRTLGAPLHVLKFILSIF